jgi:hypothetical protein
MPETLLGVINLTKILDASYNTNKNIIGYILNNVHECVLETKDNALIIRSKNVLYIDGFGVYHKIKVINSGIGSIPKCILCNPK